jgi:IclR family mhp operon transcriptional activator
VTGSAQNSNIKINRSGLRILSILETVNALGGASIAAVAERLSMSRATTYRYLETLCAGGYLHKDEASHLFYPTHAVQRLSCGFEEESWVRDCAAEALHDLSTQFIWPVAVATLSGTSMLLRNTTDASSPVAVRRFLPGQRVGIVDTASGMAYLAFLSREQRQTILQILARSEDPRNREARNAYAVRREVLQIQKNGYACAVLQQPHGNWEALAVPIFAYDRILASISVRFAQRAVSKAEAVKTLLPSLQSAAGAIGSRFEAMPARKTESPSTCMQ